MYPIIDLGFIKIPSYSLMMFVGVVAYVVYLFVALKKEGKSQKVIDKSMFVSALAFAVMGITAFLFNSLFHSIEEGRLVLGGITWAGGVVGAFPAFVVLTHYLIKEERGKEIEFFSLIVPGIVLGHAFGRIGCFLGGCCFGQVTESWLGVVFPNGSLAEQLYPNTITHEGSFPVLPTQLFEAGFEFLLFAVMLIFRKKWKYAHAEIYLFSYGIFRFGLEFLRGDDRGATGFVLSPSQLLCLLMVATAVLIVLFKRGVVFKGLKAKTLFWQEQALSGAYDKKTLSAEKTEVFQTLDKLFDLYQKGVLTEEEYAAKKVELLQRL